MAARFADQVLARFHVLFLGSYQTQFSLIFLGLYFVLIKKNSRDSWGWDHGDSGPKFSLTGPLHSDLPLSHSDPPLSHHCHTTVTF